jgi:hypothetical protein
MLHGKTALITGASSGMGADFARQLAALGCNLILTARRAERLEALKTEICAAHAVYVACVMLDLAVPNAPERLYEQLRSTGQQVDVLINNTGHGLHGQVCGQPWERLRSMLEVDIIALTHLTRLFAADMAARRSGYILQVASIGAFQPTPHYAVYAAAKSYVLNFSEALHYELRGTGVTCTALCPGTTRTEFFDAAGHQLTAWQQAVMMDSADVARIGRSCVVAGRLNSLLALATRFLPRQLLAAIACRLLR